MCAVLAATALLTACAPLSAAAREAAPRVAEVVGDSGDVSVTTTKSRVNVSPSCSARVRLDEGISRSAITRILREVWSAPGDSPCVVTAVELANRSSVSGYPAREMPAEAAAAVADALLRFGDVALAFTDDRAVAVTASSHSGRFDVAGALVRESAASAALHEAFGSVYWSLSWSHQGIPYDSVTILSDASPPITLARFLEGLGELRDSGALGQAGAPGGEPSLDAAIIGVDVEAKSEAQATTLSVQLTLENWDAAALGAQRKQLLSSGRAADAARAIAEIAERNGLPLDSVTASGVVELLPAP